MIPNVYNRLEQLDTIRGIASLQVLFHHIILCFPVGWLLFQHPDATHALASKITYSPIHFFYAGQEAVIFFFVLSGFVLSLPFYSSKPFNYFAYAIKRLFRIYIPYLVILLIAYCLLHYHTHVQEGLYSAWFYEMWRKPVTFNELMDFILLMKGDFHNLNTTLWSLGIELQVSLLLPIWIILIKRANLFISIFILCFHIALYHIGKKAGFDELFPAWSLVYFESFFLAGCLAAKYRIQLSALFLSINRYLKIILITTAIVLYTYKWTILLLPASVYKIACLIPSVYAGMIASVLFIIISLHPAYSVFFNSIVLQYVGKISFSVYMLHPIVILCCTYYLLPGTYWAIPLSVLLTMGCAILYYYTIEQTSHKAGIALSKKIQ